jgi:hypothetical protein
LFSPHPNFLDPEDVKGLLHTVEKITGESRKTTPLNREPQKRVKDVSYMSELYRYEPNNRKICM